MNETGESGTNAAQNLISENSLSYALMEFQRFAGINETGVLDDDTIHMMNAPRCGNKDKVGHGEEARRRKRYALQGMLFILFPYSHYHSFMISFRLQVAPH